MNKNISTFIKVNHRSFSIIENENGSIKCWVGKPDKNALLILTFSVNVKDKPVFVKQLSKLDYIEIREIGLHDKDMSYLVIQLVKPSFSKLLEDLPYLIFKYIENGFQNI